MLDAAFDAVLAVATADVCVGAGDDKSDELFDGGDPACWLIIGPQPVSIENDRNRDAR
jgi:hypothetical protein